MQELPSCLQNFLGDMAPFGISSLCSPVTAHGWLSPGRSPAPAFDKQWMSSDGYVTSELRFYTSGSQSLKPGLQDFGRVLFGQWLGAVEGKPAHPDMNTRTLNLNLNRNPKHDCNREEKNRQVKSQTLTPKTLSPKHEALQP